MRIMVAMNHNPHITQSLTDLQNELEDMRPKRVEITPWGWHLHLDCMSGDIKAITTKAVIRRFVADLVVAIDMVPYKAIRIDRFATHDPDKAGISFCQMIETSHIAGHFCENNGDFYLDVFSCKPFDPDVVLDHVYGVFNPQGVRVDLIPRFARG